MVHSIELEIPSACGPGLIGSVHVSYAYVYNNVYCSIVFVVPTWLDGVVLKRRAMGCSSIIVIIIFFQ